MVWSHQVPSTNDSIKSYTSGTCFVSNSQTQGRGRNNRAWISHEGNLFFSYKLSHKNINTFLPIIVGVAIHKSLLKLSEKSLFLKWPNDILNHSGKKIAGILIEKLNDDYVIGVGINTQKVDKDNDYAHLDLQVDKLWVLNIIIQNILSEILQPRKETLVYWNENSFFQLNSIVKIHFGEKGNRGVTELIGKVKGLAEDGSLLVFDNSLNKLINIYSGDIVNCRSMH